MGKRYNNKYYIIRMGGGHIVLYYIIVLPITLPTRFEKRNNAQVDK